MAFGNKGNASGSNVAFSRDEVTGEPEPSGDFLPNAQGEDVVSGVRRRRDIRQLRNRRRAVQRGLMDILRTLERHYRDMQDTQFRVEEGRLSDRQSPMADVILAEGDQERATALDHLRDLQERDFREIFEAIEGRPVTIRLLDPPFHEFLPRPEALPEGRWTERVLGLQEANPMVGARGVRAGVLYRAPVARVAVAQAAISG
jgi:phosphoenolpyruvate synthase/pyruvate phosphate dikinase